jgi:hypothetical protein
MVRSLDTSPDASRRQTEILRRMSGSDRVEMALRMSEAARELTVTGIRHRHPDWTDEQVHHALLQQLHGPEVANAIRSSRPARV